MIGELHIISDLSAFFLRLDYSFLSSWAIKMGEFSLTEHWVLNLVIFTGVCSSRFPKKREENLISVSSVCHLQTALYHEKLESFKVKDT